MRAIAGSIDGFTPMPDQIVQEHGLITASVWGRIWRYEQGDYGICKASHQKIADELGISLRTVVREIRVLLASGYIEDLTPELKNKPHSYRTTPKLRVVSNVSAMPESHSTMPQSHSHYATESREDTTKIQDKNKSESKLSRRRKPKDQRLQHPAIVGYKEQAHLNVPRTWLDDVIQLVGNDPPALERWRALVKSWVGRNFNPGNVEGMLDAYRNGGIKHGKSNRREEIHRMPEGV